MIQNAKKIEIFFYITHCVLGYFYILSGQKIV